MPKVLQHPFNCNTWRDADHVSAMPEENCSMMAYIVITAEVEIPAAGILHSEAPEEEEGLLNDDQHVTCTLMHFIFPMVEEERSTLLTF